MDCVTCCYCKVKHSDGDLLYWCAHPLAELLRGVVLARRPEEIKQLIAPTQCPLLSHTHNN